jgi:hypothetical protein
MALKDILVYVDRTQEALGRLRWPPISRLVTAATNGIVRAAIDPNLISHMASDGWLATRARGKIFAMGGGRSLKRVRPMSRKAFLNLAQLCCASLVLAAFAPSLGVQSALAANVDQRRINRPASHHHHIYAMRRGPLVAPGATLPYGPEYGFLRHVPANAIRGPGYIFVPGVGILGESCDLPTSACTNEYRDVH